MIETLRAMLCHESAERIREQFKNEALERRIAQLEKQIKKLEKELNGKQTNGKSVEGIDAQEHDGTD